MTEHSLTRILHVDDEPDIREITRLALEKIGGFAVASCASGAQAVATAPCFRPDLVLLDAMMPGMDGPATLAALHGLAAGPPAPVIFMTAAVGAADIGYLRALGALEVLAKPFDPLTLPARLNRIWADHAAV